MSGRPGFSFCVCPDAQLLRRQVDDLLAAHAPTSSLSGQLSATGSLGLSGKEASGAWERHVFWGDEELPPRFWEHLTLQGLFDKPRALVVRNAHNLPAEIWKRLSKALARPAPQAWAILCLEVGWEKDHPKIPAHISKLSCYTFAEKQQWRWTSPGLDIRGLRRHVQVQAKLLGLSIAPDALEALCATLPLQAATAEAEMEKLALFMGSQGRTQVTKEDAALAVFTPDLDIFSFLRQLQSGNSAVVWTTVLREQAKGEELIFSLLGLLQREARLLWQIMAQEPVYLHPKDATAKRQTAARLGAPGLARLWDATHTAELAVKSGRRFPAQALDALIAELTLLFAQPPQPPAQPRQRAATPLARR